MSDEDYDDYEPEPDPPTLTIAALTALLAEFDPESLVDIQGCDCSGGAGGVTDWTYSLRVPDGPRVLIERADRMGDR